MHENGQSEYNYEMDISNIKKVQRGKGKRFYLSLEQVLIQRFPKTNFQCHITNSHSQSNCLNSKYFSENLDCKLPWMKKYQEENKTVCRTQAEFDKFKALSTSILKQDVNGEIKAKECFIPNCSLRKWEVQSTNDLSNRR